MKKFIASFHLEVFADTEEEARKIPQKSLRKVPVGSLSMVKMKPSTERCVSCQSLYPPDEVAEINGEQICAFCSLDKYGTDDLELRPEDIHF